MTNFDVHGFARQLAQAMNWTYDEAHDQSWTALIHEPGTKAELWIHDDRGRARISGGFDVLQKYVRYERRGQNEITVDPKRPLVRIKADIERRLLPDYRTDLLYVQKCDAEHHARMKQVANAALHFGAILQVAPPEVSEEERVRFHLGYVGSIWGDVQVDAQSVDIKLDDVPFEIAAMMLVPIGEYIRAHPKERDE